MESFAARGIPWIGYVPGVATRVVSWAAYRAFPAVGSSSFL